MSQFFFQLFCTFLNFFALDSFFRIDYEKKSENKLWLSCFKCIQAHTRKLVKNIYYIQKLK